MIGGLWVWLGIINLALLTFQDFYNRRIVDSRHNFVMAGVSIGLLMVHSRPWYYLLLAIGLSIALSVFLHRIKGIGSADAKSLTWIVLGFSIIDIYRLGVFFAVFMLLTGIYMAWKVVIMKWRGPTPFYSVILGAFLVSVVW